MINGRTTSREEILLEVWQLRCGTIAVAMVILILA